MTLKRSWKCGLRNQLPTSYNMTDEELLDNIFNYPEMNEAEDQSKDEDELEI